MDYKKRGSWPWGQRTAIDSEPGVYAIMRGQEAVFIAQAETGVRDRLIAFEKSATTGEGNSSGGKTFFRKGLTFDELRIDVFEGSNGSTGVWADLKDHLITEYIQRTGKRPVCNTRLPSEAKAYLCIL